MKTAALGEVASINPRGEKIAADEYISFVGMAELDPDAAIARPLETRPFAEVSKGYTVFRDGDVLAAKITPCWENGKVGQAKLDHEFGVGSTEFHVLRPTPVLDDRYLLHFLRQPSVRDNGRLRMTGSAGQRRVPVAFLQNLQIPLPPLPEQRRIAAILDHADALLAKRRQVVTHLDTLAQAVFHELFAETAATTSMSSVVKEFRYGTSNKSGDSGYPTLRIPNVIGGAIDTGEIKTVAVKPAELRKLTLQNGDLLLVRTNGNQDNVGRTAIFSEAAVKSAGCEDLPWIYASYLIRARLSDGVEPRFVAAYLGSPAGRKQLRERSRTSAGQYNINIDALASIRLPVASLAAQQEFAGRARVIEAKREQVSSVALVDNELFASLQSRAFRGEL